MLLRAETRLWYRFMPAKLTERIVAFCTGRLSLWEGRLIKPKQKPPFDPKIFLAKVGDGKTIADYRKNQKMFVQGDSADAIFYIQEGKVKLTVLSNQGKEAVIGILGAGDFFGEGCLSGRPLRMSAATAMTDCTVVRLDKRRTIRVLHDEPAFAELFLSYVLSRNMRLEEDLVDQLFNSSEKRLARVLLLLANFGKEGKPEPIIAKISQETLAEIIGTTRARVSSFMNKFRKLGFIEYNGELHVHTSLLNVILHD
jgi:CRP/FNR family cyclic AMP-dependent transcriptional regulator